MKISKPVYLRYKNIFIQMPTFLTRPCTVILQIRMLVQRKCVKNSFLYFQVASVDILKLWALLLLMGRQLVHLHLLQIVFITMHTH